MSNLAISATPTSTPADRHATEGLDRLTAAMPEVIHKVMQEVLPDKYTPELADAIAADVIAELTRPRPLTAAQRGTKWMALYGCNSECQMDHAGPDGQPGWHSTNPIETTLRDIESDPDSDAPEVPWLAAQVVVVNDKPQAYGRQTRVWLHYGLATSELTPAKAREALEEMRGFVAQLQATVEEAERIAIGDFAGDPEIAAADRGAEDRRIKRITEGLA